MKKLDTVLNQYFNKTHIDDLKALAYRLNERIGADVAEALNEMSTCSDLEKWLSSTKNGSELYDLLDIITTVLNKKLSEKDVVAKSY